MLAMGFGLWYLLGMLWCLRDLRPREDFPLTTLSSRLATAVALGAAWPLIRAWEKFLWIQERRHWLQARPPTDAAAPAPVARFGLSATDQPERVKERIRENRLHIDQPEKEDPPHGHA